MLCILTAGAACPQAYLVGHAIQVAAIGLGFLVPIMFFVGAMFAALWFGAFFLGRGSRRTRRAGPLRPRPSQVVAERV